MTEYLIPTGHSETEFTEKRSRFIGRVWRVSSEEEARQRIEETRKSITTPGTTAGAISSRTGRCAIPTTGSPRAPRASPC